MSLREKVRITTPAGTLHGELFVGADGLPALAVRSEQLGPRVASVVYTPATFPAAWSLEWIPQLDNVLIDSWRSIERCRKQIRDAQRDAEAEARPCDDCGEPNPCRCFDALPGRCEIEQAKAHMEAYGER